MARCELTVWGRFHHSHPWTDKSIRTQFRGPEEWELMGSFHRRLSLYPSSPNTSHHCPPYQNWNSPKEQEPWLATPRVQGMTRGNWTNEPRGHCLLSSRRTAGQTKATDAPSESQAFTENFIQVQFSLPQLAFAHSLHYHKCPDCGTPKGTRQDTAPPGTAIRNVIYDFLTPPGLDEPSYLELRYRKNPTFCFLPEQFMSLSDLFIWEGWWPALSISTNSLLQTVVISHRLSCRSWRALTSGNTLENRR